MKFGSWFVPAVLASVSLVGVLSGCSSSKYIHSEVVSNSDRTLKTPDWVLSPKDMIEEGANVVYIHRMNPSGDIRPDACVAMARTQAMGEMMKYIKTAITASGQVEDINGAGDPSYSALTAFLSQGNLSGAKISDSYWEQSIESDASGTLPVKRLLCAVKVSIDKKLLEKQMKDATQGSAPGGNPEIRQKLIDAQKNFLDSVAPATKSQEGNTP